MTSQDGVQHFVSGFAYLDDPTQLMHGDASLVTTFQSGDLAGLAALGRGPCAPTV